MKYRLGRKQNRALLDDKGHEVALFSKGQEDLAKKVCKLLNHEINLPSGEVAISSNALTNPNWVENKQLN
tara:strand:+ start:469 stop:678 length:210 start_codon:yes stop_codon:yes gene_type:complete